MDNPGIAAEKIQVACHAIVKAHPEGDDQIGVEQGTIGLHSAVHAHHAEAQGMIHRNRRKSVQGKGDGDVSFFGQFLKSLPGIAGNHPVAAKNDRSFTFVDQSHGLPDPVAIRRG